MVCSAANHLPQTHSALMVFLAFDAEALAREVMDYLAIKQIWRALLPLRLSVKELAVRCLNYLALNPPDVKAGDVAMRQGKIIDEIEKQIKKLRFAGLLKPAPKKGVKSGLFLLCLPRLESSQSLVFSYN